MPCSCCKINRSVRSRGFLFLSDLQFLRGVGIDVWPVLNVFYRQMIADSGDSCALGKSLVVRCFQKYPQKNTLTVSFTAVHGNYYQSKHSLASIILRAVHSRLSACVRLMIPAIFL